jgi:tetratricopeptide (TPR) repeat protein
MKAWNAWGGRMRHLSWLSWFAVVIFLVAAVGGTAWAQDKAERAARAHFQRAEKAFSLGKFEEALAGYEAAYEAKALPGLLFNIAQCHRNLGHHERAIFFYKRYLALDPDGPNRKMVEELIEEQQRQLDEKNAAQGAPSAGADPALPTATSPPAPAAPPEAAIMATKPQPDFDQALPGERDLGSKSQPVFKQWWFWGAASVVVGGVAAAMLIKREGPGPSGKLGVIQLDSPPR